MNIQVNGQLKEFTSPQNLHQIAATLCKNTHHVIAEVNGTMIKKDTWNETHLSNGDVIELISFVGGG